LWRVLDNRGLLLPSGSINEADIVFLVSPIEANESSIFTHGLSSQQRTIKLKEHAGFGSSKYL